MTEQRSFDASAELLPCPFCGKTFPAIGCVTGFRRYAGEEQAVSRIECTCGARGPIAFGTLTLQAVTLQADALRAWNARVPAQQHSTLCASTPTTGN